MTDVVLKTIIAEAGGDPKAMAAVASVIHNRAVKEGKTPEQIVKAHGQFEGYSNPGPKSKQAQKDPAVVARAADVWNGVKSGTIADPTNGGTFYHAASISPYWAKSENKHGSVNIGGNVFYKGSKALDAINAVAPTPQSRPDALAYADNGSVTPKLPHISGNLSQLGNAAMNGVGPLPGSVDLQPMTPGQDYALPGQTIYNRPDYASLVAPRVGAQVQPPAFRASATGGVSAGAAGNGSGALMPQLPRPRPDTPSAPLTSRSVHTVAIDPTTGNPISAVQMAANAEANRLRGNSGNSANSGNSKNSPGSSLIERGTPYPAPPKVTFYAKDKIAQEDAARLGDIVGQMAGNPSPKPVAPRVASIPSSMIERGTPYAPAAPAVPPSPVRVASASPPYIPGPNGYIDPNKNTSQLQPTTALAFGSPVQQAPAVQAITHQIVNPAYTAWQASQTQPLHAGQAYTAGGSVVSQAAQNAFGGMAPNTNIAAVPLPRPRPAPPHYLTIHTPPGPQAIDPWSSARYGIPAVPRPGMVTAPAVQSRVAPHPGGLLGILGGLFNGGGAPPAPAAPQAPGYNGQTSVTSDQLAGANQGFGGTNALMPDSMNNSRWLTGY